MTILSNNIGWCDDTTNAVTGCDKVSEGCKFCYAQIGTRARVLRAQGTETWGPNGVRHPVAEFAKKIRRLNKLCICDNCHMTYKFNQVGGLGHCGALGGCGGSLRRIRLFADSNSDWLDEKWKPETLAAFLDEIRLAPNVDVLLLTKRVESWGDRLHKAMRVIHNETDAFISSWLDGVAPKHLWFGVSVENQKRADERIPQLLDIPSAVRFISAEPLLEDVNFKFRGMSCGFPKHITSARRAVGMPLGIHWVIVGGESGPKRRDCGVKPILSIAEQCRLAGVPCYVKQDCMPVNGQQGRIPDWAWGMKEFPIR